MLKCHRRLWIDEFCGIAHAMRKSEEEFRPALALRNALHAEIPELCYAVPGKTLIDLVFDESGLTHCFRKTLEETRKEYPDAVLMTLDEFCQSKAARQDSPVRWIEITEKQYDDALEVLPPVGWRGTRFCLGEPSDHHATTGRPRYAGYMRTGAAKSVFRYWTTSRPVTVKELHDLPAPQ